jgi:hypothetical protein
VFSKSPIRFRDAGLQHTQLPSLLNNGLRQLSALIGFSCGWTKIVLCIPFDRLDKHALFFIGFKSIHDMLLSREDKPTLRSLSL